MGTQHKHRDLIVQWANGAEWVDSKEPAWDELSEYRIKPQTIKYRIALLKGEDFFYTISADDKHDESSIESFRNFSRWLTDWVEVEV